MRSALMGVMIRLKDVCLALAIAASVGTAAGAATKEQIEAITSALRARDFDAAVDLAQGNVKQDNSNVRRSSQLVH